eukprot:4043996-Lingulodinium_polyedra.AAC.1
MSASSACSTKPFVPEVQLALRDYRTKNFDRICTVLDRKTTFLIPGEQAAVPALDNSFAWNCRD